MPKIDFIFINKINSSNNKKEFIDGFNKIIIKDVEKLKDELDKVQPHFNPTILILIEKIYYIAGGVNSAGIITAWLERGGKLTDDHLKLIKKICFDISILDNISKICKNIIEISKRAKNNELFIVV